MTTASPSATTATTSSVTTSSSAVSTITTTSATVISTAATTSVVTATKTEPDEETKVFKDFNSYEDYRNKNFFHEDGKDRMVDGVKECKKENEPSTENARYATATIIKLKSRSGCGKANRIVPESVPKTILNSN